MSWIHDAGVVSLIVGMLTIIVGLWNQRDNKVDGLRVARDNEIKAAADLAARVSVAEAHLEEGNRRMTTIEERLGRLESGRQR